MKKNNLLIGITPPCAPDCEGRNAMCHANCEKYAEYKEKLEIMRGRRTDEIRIRDAGFRAMEYHKRKCGAYKPNKKKLR